MKVFIGGDHRGFALKARLLDALKKEGYDVTDMGDREYVQTDDFPEFAAAVAREVKKNPAENRGIVVCGSGFGVDIAANKFKGIRAALAMSPEHAMMGRHDDDVNVLAIAADMVDDSKAIAIAKVFLLTPFEKEERYERRIKEISDFEK